VNLNRRAAIAVVALLGCSSGGASSGTPAPSTLAAMIDGQWSYRSLVPATMALELELSRVGSGDSLTGRVLHWMSGDVGQAGSIRLSGGIRDSAVWFEIPLPSASAVRIEGTLSGDTLVINKATTGGDDNGLTGGRFVRTGPVTKS
jgi:hypothetical protein